MAAKTLKGAEPLLRFVARQARQIRVGGLPVLLRKVTNALMLAPAAVVLLVALMARPLVLIRFGRMKATRIGPFSGDVEVYLCRRDAGIHKGRKLDILFSDGSACNQQLKRMWDRTLLSYPWARWPYILASQVPGLGAHVVAIDSQNERDVLGLLARIPAHLSFTAEEEELGQAALRELGIPQGAPYICFLARDSAYLTLSFPGRTSEGHNYRDSCIHNHVPAAEELTRRGYFALRMGAIVKEALHTTNPMIVDYATKHRSDFLDIYLASKCRFFLGDPSGYICVPVLFRRPLATVNMIPLVQLHSWDPNYLSIPKKLWLRKEHCFMTFQEQLDLEPSPGLSSSQYEQLGIDVIENTPEEITALAVEMDERLNGTWQTTEEDEELQRRFWSLFESSELHGVLRSRIGTEFLRQNRELLG